MSNKKDLFDFKEEYLFWIFFIWFIVLIKIPTLEKNESTLAEQNAWILTLEKFHYPLILKIFLILWSILSFYLAFLLLKKYLIIFKLPISKLVSAAQGYVATIGTSYCLPNKQLKSPLSNSDCTWYAYSIKEQSGKYYYEVEEGESKEPFLLKDDTDECIVNPEGANIFTQYKKTWKEGSWFLSSTRIYTEFLLFPYEQLYVSGVFKTVIDPKIKEKANEVSKLIKEWKKNNYLLKKFNLDPDNDGIIKEEDWEKVVQAAEQEIIETKPELNKDPNNTVNMISNHGLALDQPFIISSISKSSLLRKLYIKFIFYIICFFCLLVASCMIHSSLWSVLIS